MFRHRIAVLLAGAALPLVAGGVARAQQVLPEIEVSAPAADLPGTLPVAADRFGSVTVVPNEELRRNGGTLGDTLFGKAGITGSSFAPGASSRPVVRGLDNN